MVTIPNLTEITSPNDTDDFVVETGAGTRRVSRRNAMIRGTELTVLEPDNINLTGDLVWFSDATDNVLKGISVFDLIFGNYTSLSITDQISLDPAVHNIRPLELNGTFNTPNINLDDATVDIAGATFNLFNFTQGIITVTPIGGMTMFNDGVDVGSANIRENTGASIQVRDNGSEAIFVGG